MPEKKKLDNVFYVIDIDDIIEIILATDIFVLPNIGDRVIIDINSIPEQEVEIRNFIHLHGSNYTVEKIRQDSCQQPGSNLLEQWELVFLKLQKKVSSFKIAR